jgi:hypothetical protein
MTPKPLIVTIDVSCSPESPCDNDGWKLYSFARSKFITDVNPDEYVEDYNRQTGEVTPANPELAEKLEKGLAFWLSYHEHGLCQWFLKGSGGPRCQWDTTSLAGILVWEYKEDDIGGKTYADREKDADAFMENYTEWANGHVHDWSVREPGEEENIESGHEWAGTDGMLAEIKKLVGDRPVIARGELAWMLDKKEYNVVDEDELLEELLADDE